MHLKKYTKVFIISVDSKFNRNVSLVGKQEKKQNNGKCPVHVCVSDFALLVSFSKQYTIITLFFIVICRSET